MLLKSLIITTILVLNINILAVAAEIEDDIVLRTFANKSLTKQVYNNKIIEDEAIKNELCNKEFSKVIVNNQIIEDTDVISNPELQTASKPAFKIKLINENDKIIKVAISPTSIIKPNKSSKEGEKVTFKVLNDVYSNEKIYIKKETPVEAFIETLTPPSRGGDPAQLNIGRFTTTDINGNKIDLHGEIQKQGANRAIWVRPLTDIASNVHIYAAPLLLLYFIKGGKAEINTNQEFVLYSES